MEKKRLNLFLWVSEWSLTCDILHRHQSDLIKQQNVWSASNFSIFASLYMFPMDSVWLPLVSAVWLTYFYHFLKCWWTQAYSFPHNGIFQWNEFWHLFILAIISYAHFDPKKWPANIKICIAARLWFIKGILKLNMKNTSWTSFSHVTVPRPKAKATLS